MTKPVLPARPLQTRQVRPEMHAWQETRVFNLAALGIKPPAGAPKAQAPGAKPRLAPPPQLKAEELSPGRRPREEALASSAPAPIDEAPAEPELAPPRPPQSRLKLAGYSALGLAVALSALSMLHPAATETEARAATPQHAQPTPGPSSAPQTLRAVAPPRNGPPSAKLAADYYATGDWARARSEYEALAAVPGADPVFAVIARALEHRSTRAKVKP
jgi:hypothetical protein